MADDGRTPQDGVATEPRTEVDPRELGFYAALRHLDATFRSAPRLGEAAHTSEEPVRLGQDPSLAFDARPVTAYEPPSDRGPAQLRVSFFGVWGPNGPMPLHLTEHAYQRMRNERDPTFAHFVDVFHHRLLSLRYRAWANTQPAVEHDRPQSDRFARYVSSAIGQGHRPKTDKDGHLERFAQYMACHFTRSSREPEGLAKILSTYFDAPVAVEEFVGEWLDIPDEYVWPLGKQSASTSALGKLGVGTRLGRRAWDRQGKFRVVIGPVGRAQYERLLPGGPDVPDLIALVRRYAGPELAWEVRLVLRQPEMQPFRLSAGRLSRTTYLLSETTVQEKRWKDLTYNPLTSSR